MASGSAMKSLKREFSVENGEFDTSLETIELVFQKRIVKTIPSILKSVLLPDD